MNMKAFSVFGFHHTGKTTLVAKLIKSLSDKGFKVATIKDIHNENYHADTEGSNSWKHIQAGAVMTFARGLKDTALIFPQRLSLKEMASFLTCDYLIIEGMREAPVPKILCAETIEQLQELMDPIVFAVSGKIAAQEILNLQIPVLDAENELEDLTRLVLDKVFDLLPDNDPACCSACGLTCHQMAAAILKGEKQRSDCHSDHPQQVTLTIDGKEIVLVPFVQNLLRDVVSAFIANLKDVDPEGNIRLEITRHD